MTKLKILPHPRATKVETGVSKYNKSWDVYGVLICYTLNGQKRAYLKDMTKKIESQGFFDLHFHIQEMIKAGL